MYYIADLHVHSRYAYATSPQLDIENLYKWAYIKGVTVVGTGDFTHPTWLEEIEHKLMPADNGFYQLKTEFHPLVHMHVQPSAPHSVFFCLSMEVSCIYAYGGKVRKSHHLIYAPDIATVKRLNKRLACFGNLQSDGRPVLRITARDLLEVILETSLDCHLIPAHIWTPWFSIFGSRSGYDHIEACFRDLTPYIFALETGLSSDPAMNRMLSNLDHYRLVSNSDAHSAHHIGREATCFDTDLTYDALFATLKGGEGFCGTFEFFPEEGKYYYDGHRQCGIVMDPQQTISCGGICPRCGKKLTLGVRHQVEKLADRCVPLVSNEKIITRYIVPLPEIISQIVKKGVRTKSVQRVYVEIINRFGNEFTFLWETPLGEIRSFLPSIYAVAIERLRTGKVRCTAGYDGKYGSVEVLEKNGVSIF